MSKRFWIWTADHSGLPIADQLQREGFDVVLVMIRPEVLTGKHIPTRRFGKDLSKAPKSNANPEEWLKWINTLMSPEEKSVANKILYLEKNGTGSVTKMWAHEAINKIQKGDYAIWDQIWAPHYGEMLCKRGVKVLGGSQVGYNLEVERKKTLNLLKHLGFDVPYQKHFGPNSVDQAIQFLEKANDETLYALKSDNSKIVTLVAKESNDKIIKKLKAEKKYIDQDNFLLQEKKCGIEFNVETLYSNSVPIACAIDIEAKNKYNETSSSQTGCSFDLCWFVPIDHPLREKLNVPLDKFSGQYINTGFIDISVIYDYHDDKYWALELCGSRNGYNSWYTTYVELNQVPLGEFYMDLLDGRYKKDIYGEILSADYAASLRLFNDEGVSDQIISIEKEYREHFHIWDYYKKNGAMLSVGGDIGESIGIVTAHADTPEGAMSKIRHYYEQIDMPSLWARDDYDDVDEVNLPLYRFNQMKRLKLI